MEKSGVKYAIDKNYIPSPRAFGENVLYQVGRMHSAPSNVVGLHAHLDWYELTVVTEGSGEVLTNGVPVKVCKGDIYFSFPNEFHEIRSSSDDPLNFCFFAFETKNNEILERLEDIRKQCVIVGCDSRVFCDERINFLVGNIISELNEEKIYAYDQVCAMMKQVVRYTVRAFTQFDGISEKRGVSKPDELCYRIMNYIDTHIYTMSGLTDVASAMHYNYSYISDMFKKTTSETISSYYRRKRLDAARLLLAEGKLNVTQIAEMLNFSSIYTFSRSYKDYFGVSPNESRKKDCG